MSKIKTKVVQAGYTKSLDYLGAAVAEYRKGNYKNASRLFAAAATDSSVSYAMKAIHATNRLGLERLQASAGKTASPKKTTARRRLRANDEFVEEFEPTDEDTMAVLESLSDTVEEEIVDDIEDDLEDELDAEEDDIDDIIEAKARGKAFASALRRVSARR